MRYDATGLGPDVGRSGPRDLRRRGRRRHRRGRHRGDSVGARAQPHVVDPPADEVGVLVTGHLEDHAGGLSGERGQVDAAGAVSVAVTTEDLGRGVTERLGGPVVPRDRARGPRAAAERLHEHLSAIRVVGGEALLGVVPLEHVGMVEAQVRRLRGRHHEGGAGDLAAGDAIERRVRVPAEPRAGTATGVVRGVVGGCALPQAVRGEAELLDGLVVAAELDLPCAGGTCGRCLGVGGVRVGRLERELGCRGGLDHVVAVGGREAEGPRDPRARRRWRPGSGRGRRTARRR